MNQYLFTFVATILFVGLIQIAAFEAQLGQATQDSYWLHEAIEKKQENARSAESPKIVILAGSNAMFSIQAQAIEEALGVPTYNLGTHAGLQVEFILDRIPNSLQCGDVVVLPLEYELYAYDGETTVTLLDYASARDPDYLRADLGRYLYNAFAMSPRELVQRNHLLLHNHPHANQPSVDKHSIYTADDINSWGDKGDLNIPWAPRVRELMESYGPIEFSFDQEKLGAKLIKRFMLDCKKHGITPILTFPTTIDFEAYLEQSFISEVEKLKKYYESEGLIVMGQPSDFMHPINMFLDTRYHANQEGRQRTSQRLAELLQEQREIPTGSID